MVYLGNPGYMIATFHFLRLLNPILVKNCQKMFIFRQKFDVWWLHNSQELTFVVSKWCHNVTWKSGCFPASWKMWLFEEFWHFGVQENGVILGVLCAWLMRYDRLAEFLQRGFGSGMTWQVDLVASTSITALLSVSSSLDSSEHWASPSGRRKISRLLR